MLTSKLIDGTFPDYQRVIPAGNDKQLVVERGEFAKAVDRVSTISSERGRAVKLALADGRLTLTVTNPDSGSATEELEVDYDAAPLDIGFNARYLLDIAGQLDGDTALFKLADPGSPTLIQDREGAAGALRPDADAGVIPSRCATGQKAEQAPPERVRPHPVALRATRPLSFGRGEKVLDNFSHLVLTWLIPPGRGARS